jgi:uncharacterized protein Veg
MDQYFLLDSADALCYYFYSFVDTLVHLCYNCGHEVARQVSLVAEVNVLSRIREDLKELVGKPVRLRANRGRKRVLEVDGILEQIYPNIFVVRWNDRQTERRTSYNYADLLTKEVELLTEDIAIG